MGTTAPHGNVSRRYTAARLGCLGGRPRSRQRHGPRRRGPIHGPRLHRPHCPASRSSASRLCPISSCSSPASPARASTASGAAGRDAHWRPVAPVHPAVHCAPRPVASAATGPSARAVHNQRPTRGGAFATATCWPLTPFQPSLSPAIPPTFRQRGAFAAADERAKGTVHFSDNDKKFGKKGRGRKDKGRAREIQLTNMRNAL